MKKTLVAFLVGGALVTSGIVAGTINSSDQVQTIDISGSKVKAYSTLSNLEADADIIAEVNAKEVKSFEFQKVPFTVTTAEVKKVYRGTGGKEVNILETGGIFDSANYTFEGNEVFKKNDSAIVFLKKYSGPVAENAYTILGVTDGKFLVNGNKITPPKGSKIQVNSVQGLNLE
ncbi:hypothetical protein NLX71_25370 [Paenibacillus sp. MZ04-78.2]|uniref:hypothetical protein n=1 Tax=Paenibacillus sp. MZ04-78.2 TaxID=2962034 RepID=UPI0020B80C9C|nr:hypothetical protein [Paenibacillus sp. MZ04-78.2]MCP3776579.1 hypothetical protein [Paenibacillus sp. MZ04-78.2]